MLCTLCCLSLYMPRSTFTLMKPSSNYIVFINPTTTQQLQPSASSGVSHQQQQYQETSAVRKTTAAEVKQTEEKIDTSNV